MVCICFNASFWFFFFGHLNLKSPRTEHSVFVSNPLSRLLKMLTNNFSAVLDLTSDSCIIVSCIYYVCTIFRPSKHLCWAVWQQLCSNWLVYICRIDKPKALSLLLHTADISHPAKHWDLHHRWTTSLLEEFFRQVVTQIHPLPDLSL